MYIVHACIGWPDSEGRSHDLLSVEDPVYQDTSRLVSVIEWFLCSGGISLTSRHTSTPHPQAPGQVAIC